jgi:transposase InsO family protein
LRRSVESTQYTAREFAQFCKDKHARTSVGRTGVCWDNAAAESFFAALKNEMYNWQPWPTRARARFAVADYIEILSRYAGDLAPGPWDMGGAVALSIGDRRWASLRYCVAPLALAAVS